MVRLFAGIVFCSLQAFTVLGQQRMIDSLTRVLEATENSPTKADLLNDLSSALYDFNAERAFNYASQAHDLAAELDYTRGIRRSLTLKGFYYYGKGEYPKALTFYKRSADVPMPEDDLFGYNLVMAGNTLRTQARYDSARTCYRRAIEVFTRTKSDNFLAYCYKNIGRLNVILWENGEAEVNFRKALRLYEGTDNRIGIADTWFSLADVSKNKALYDTTTLYIEKGCTLAETLDDDFLRLQCLISRGTVKYHLGDYTASLMLFFEALGVLKSKDLPRMMSTVYASIGDVYRALGQNDVAMKFYREALKIAERINIQYEIARLHANIALVYRNQNNLKKAHEFIDQSLIIRTTIHDENGVSLCYNIKGVLYSQEKNYTEALRLLQQALVIRRRQNNREGISSTLYNLSQVFAAQNQLPRALALQAQALAVEEAVGNKFTIGFSHNRLGSIYTRLKKFPQAEGHLRRAQKIVQEIRSQALVMSNELNWSEYYEARGRTTPALQHYKRYLAAHDSLYSDIGTQKLAELQALYLIDQKDQEIELLNQEKTIQENEILLQRSQINLQNIVIISAAIGFILVSLLAFMTYQYNRRIKKANREITEQKEEIQSQSEELIDANQTIAEINRKLEEKIEERTEALSQAYKELDTFFYRSSHDFRRPLTTFLGLAEVAKITVKDANALELFEKVKETAFNLDKMLVKLQSISDVGSQQLVYKEVMIREIFETVCDGFRDELHRKNVKTSTEIRLSGPFVSYPAMVKIIIENLVENAIHFSGVENPFIRLKATQNGDYINIDVQDNGQGIAKEYQEQVFDMYFRANERSKGNGLGLYIVKKAVEKLDGSITFSSIPLVGTTFTIMLPSDFHSRANR